MSKALARESNKMDHKDNETDGQGASAFGARIRERAQAKGLTAADLGRLAKIKKQSMSGYWAGERLCGSDKLFELADALDVSARWLVTGQRTFSKNDLLPVSEADFEWVPRFDLRELHDRGKGDSVETLPFRKDWLARTLGTSSELWLTALLSGYSSKKLEEGDLVFCREIEPQELAEGNICLFRINGGIVIGEYSFTRTVEMARGIMTHAIGNRASGAYLAPTEELVIASSEVGDEEDMYVPIARILGKWVQRI